LNNNQKAGRIKVSTEMVERLEIELDFLTQVITGDQNWVFEYDAETWKQCEEWHTPKSPRQKKARISKSKIKKMVILLFSQGSL
jgi:hypothetical protein